MKVDGDLGPGPLDVVDAADGLRCELVEGRRRDCSGIRNGSIWRKKNEYAQSREVRLQPVQRSVTVTVTLLPPSRNKGLRMRSRTIRVKITYKLP